MSRTYKDRPHWVKINDKSRYLLEETHAHHRIGRSFTTFYGTHIEFSDHCTIDEPETDNKWNFSKTCHYELKLIRRYYNNKPTKEMRKNQYWNPMRTDENIAMKSYAKQYNSTGEIYEEHFLRENTNSSTYGGDYWD